MRKWAYEIHSSFLVPGAVSTFLQLNTIYFVNSIVLFFVHKCFFCYQPLRLNNVDESVAREIDDVLLKESDKEEIMRKVSIKLNKYQLI